MRKSNTRSSVGTERWTSHLLASAKCTFYPLIAALSLLSMQASTLEGQIKLAYSDSPFAENVFQKEFGDLVKATCKWYAGEFFAEETVFAGITVKNTGP